MGRSTIVRGGDILDELGTGRAELRLADGAIVEVSVSIDPSAGDEAVDACGCLVVLGLVDLQAHLCEPASGHVDSRETGTAAATRAA